MKQEKAETIVLQELGKYVDAVPIMPPLDEHYELLDMVVLKKGFSSKMLKTPVSNDWFESTGVNLQEQQDTDLADLIIIQKDNEDESDRREFTVETSLDGNLLLGVEIKGVPLGLHGENTQSHTVKVTTTKGKSSKLQGDYEDTLNSVLDRVLDKDPMLKAQYRHQLGSATVRAAIGVVQHSRQGTVEASLIADGSTGGGVSAAKAFGLFGKLGKKTSVSSGTPKDDSTNGGPTAGTIAAKFLFYRVERRFGKLFRSKEPIAVLSGNSKEDLLAVISWLVMDETLRKKLKLAAPQDEPMTETKTEPPETEKRGSQNQPQQTMEETVLSDKNTAPQQQAEMQAETQQTIRPLTDPPVGIVIQLSDPTAQSLAGALQDLSSRAPSVVSESEPSVLRTDNDNGNGSDATTNDISKPSLDPVVHDTLAGQGDSTLSTSHTCEAVLQLENNNEDSRDSLPDVAALLLSAGAILLYWYYGSYNIVVRGPIKRLSHLYELVKKSPLDIPGNGWSLVKVRPAIAFDPHGYVLPFLGDVAHVIPDADIPCGILRYEPNGLAYLLPLRGTAKKTGRAVSMYDEGWKMTTLAVEIANEGFKSIEGYEEIDKEPFRALWNGDGVDKDNNIAVRQELLFEEPLTRMSDEESEGVEEEVGTLVVELGDLPLERKTKSDIGKDSGYSTVTTETMDVLEDFDFEVDRQGFKGQFRQTRFLHIRKIITARDIRVGIAELAEIVTMSLKRVSTPYMIDRAKNFVLGCTQEGRTDELNECAFDSDTKIFQALSLLIVSAKAKKVLGFMTAQSYTVSADAKFYFMEAGDAVAENELQEIVNHGSLDQLEKLVH